MKRATTALLGIAVALAVAGLFCVTPRTGVHETGPTAPTDRPAAEKSGQHDWATKLEGTGIPNFHRVTKDLYRGAQPSAEGMRELKEMGVKTIVNLRSFHSDRDEIGDIDFHYEHMTMKAWHPEGSEVVRFLKIVTDQDRTPVFVHCQYGADRTGTMCAIYRIAVCGWSKDEALKEMTEGKFGFHKTWSSLLKYVNNLDMQDVKKKAGLLRDDTE